MSIEMLKKRLEHLRRKRQMMLPVSEYRKLKAEIEIIKKNIKLIENGHHRIRK